MSNNTNLQSTTTPKFRLKKLKYQIQQFEKRLNVEQKEADKLVESKTLTIISGKAGSGKTLLSCYVALKKLANREIDNIVVTRPTVSTEDNGFLPGGIEDKLGPWIAPIYSNFRTILHNPNDPTSLEIYDQLIASKLLEIVPLTFMRGRTFTNSFVIVDEAQNLTEEQSIMVTSRIGVGTKMVICGDLRQVDLRRKEYSGMWFLGRLRESANIGRYTLLKNHRHAVVDEILEFRDYINSSSYQDIVLAG